MKAKLALLTGAAAGYVLGTKAGRQRYDELKAMADKLKGTDMQVFADGGLGGWNILPWIWSGGGNITDPDLTKATYGKDTERRSIGSFIKLFHFTFHRVLHAFPRSF